LPQETYSDVCPSKWQKASFMNGVLHIEMPKTEEARQKSIKIKVD
jgi:HSP20 family molecular chaperone IbpA